MKRPHRHIIAAATAACILLGAGYASAAGTKGWEPVRTEYSSAKKILKETDFEIRVSPGVIMVSANREVQIKIFTILGRLVNSETLQPGTSRLTLPAHGVYIVKVNDITCKIAV